jgi:hypothetical protein
MTKKTAVVDMDGVICEEGPTFERSLAREVSGARERLEALRDAGYRIIIHTARSWSELAVTEEWLYERGIFYDQLVMGKPVADILVDDRAVSSLEQAVTVTEGDTSGKPVTESQKQLHEPVAWAVVRPDGEITSIAFRLTDARGHATGCDRVVPLYPQPMLSDEEREVLGRVADDASYRATRHTERVVRQLLERSTVAGSAK